jgi:biotin carboxyl carrier protein
VATYLVNVGNHEYKVDITGDKVAVDGKPIEASLTSLNNGGLVMLRKENRTRELHVLKQDSSSYAVMVNGRHLIAQVEKNNGKARKRQEQTNNGLLNAPMPGMVIDVLAREGQCVERGDPLIVMESMKMQMILRAPQAGEVIHVAVGRKDQVEKGTMLVQIANN